MKDEEKTRDQVIAELVQMRQRIAELEASNRNYRKAKEEIKRAYGELDQIFNTAADGMRIIDKDFNVLRVNGTFLTLAGVNEEQALAEKCYEVFRGSTCHTPDCSLVRVLASGKRVEYELDKERKDGTKIPCIVTATPFRKPDGSLIGIVEDFKDISEIKRAEEQIHALTQQLMRTQEDARRRIAHDLHDQVAQELSCLRITCNNLLYNQPEMREEIRQAVSELGGILEGSVMAVRNLAYELRPPDLDQFGLPRTVFNYCQDFSERTGVSVDFQSAGLEKVRLDFDTEINLYRLIQEALSNVEKHSHATVVTIRLVASFPDVILRIEDDGDGFDVHDRLRRAVEEKRFGLLSMQERVSLLHGRMEIESQPAAGTKILVEVPYKERKSGSESEDIDH